MVFFYCDLDLKYQEQSTDLGTTFLKGDMWRFTNFKASIGWTWTLNIVYRKIWKMLLLMLAFQFSSKWVITNAHSGCKQWGLKLGGGGFIWTGRIFFNQETMIYHIIKEEKIVMSLMYRLIVYVWNNCSMTWSVKASIDVFFIFNNGLHDSK